MGDAETKPTEMAKGDPGAKSLGQKTKDALKNPVDTVKGLSMPAKLLLAAVVVVVLALIGWLIWREVADENNNNNNNNSNSNNALTNNNAPM